jgi:3-oxoacyl-[acyl-carrier protein] reductase
MLKGKVALVTGGAGEIGQAISRKLAESGAAVCLTYVGQRERAEGLAAEIIATGGQALASRIDVRQRQQVRELVARLEADWGRLDVLVNNAGINKPNDLDQISDEDWDEIMAVNLKGPFICTQEVLPALKRAGSGSIVNIGSISGQYGGPRTAHYAASKAGLISLGQVTARFAAKDDIRCNTLAVGQVQSEMTAASLDSPAMRDVKDRILLKRFGRPEEIAEAVLFLASNTSSYVTGQTLGINGGLYF